MKFFINKPQPYNASVEQVPDVGVGDLIHKTNRWSLSTALTRMNILKT